MKKTRKPKKQNVRGLQKKLSQLKQRMARFRNWGRPSFNRPRVIVKTRYRGGRRSGIPIVGRLIPRALQPFVILAALVGGAWYFFKEPLKGMIAKITHKQA